MGNIGSQNYGIYVINLDKRKDRLQYIDNLLKSKGLIYSRISAVDGKKHKTIPEIASSQGYNNLKCLGDITRTSHLAHTGCYLSHLKCLKMAKDDVYDKVLILEDDAKFIIDDFKNTIDSIYASNKDADIIWFNAPFETEVIQKYQMPTWGLQGYMVNKKAAKLLYELLNPDSNWVKQRRDCLIDIIFPVAVRELGLKWKVFSLITQNKAFTSNIAGS